MPALVQDLALRIGEEAGRGGAEARPEFKSVERRPVQRAEARIFPPLRGAVGQPPAQRAALEILVDAGCGKAVEALDGAIKTDRVDAELRGETLDRVGARHRRRYRGA